MTENELSKIIIGCAMNVHTTLGPGLLESAYEECTFYEIKKCGLNVVKQKPLPLVYGKKIGYWVPYRFIRGK